MAKPRVFLSSTCYDLKELRSQIRDFINNYGYDAVLSEFGDIFFEYGVHPQDACFSEIKKCHLFILIIGNSYGSLYYRQNNIQPSSITMKEFEEAIRRDIPKHVFINRFVEYDYQNYIRSWSNKLKDYKAAGNILDEQKEMEKFKESFDNEYPFPQESYRHLFRFIDAIYKNNLSVITFEYAEEIKNSLTKQWAGAMYDYLTSNKSIPKEYIGELFAKVDKINDAIFKIADSRKEDGNKVSFDLNLLSSNNLISSIEQIKDKVFNSLQEILPYKSRHNSIRRRENLLYDENDITSWIQNLNDNLDILKWRPYVNISEIFYNLGEKIAFYYPTTINPINVLNLCIAMNTCKESFAVEEYNSLLRAIAAELNTTDVADELPF